MANEKAARILDAARIMAEVPDELTGKAFDAWVIEKLGALTFDQFDQARRLHELAEAMVDG